MTIKIPTDAELADGLSPEGDNGPPVLVGFVGREGDDDSPRDTTKPVMKDANGNPLYAPRGITFTFGR